MRAELTRELIAFDAVIHVDQSSGVVPLERGSGWAERYDRHDLAETYPFGL